jgi:hypothetical protein
VQRNALPYPTEVPLTADQRQRVLDAITTGHLRLDPPTKMYAGFGVGRACDGCGEAIDRTMVEHEVVYENGRDGASSGEVVHLHLGCAGLLDAARRQGVKAYAPGQDGREGAEQ